MALFALFRISPYHGERRPLSSPALVAYSYYLFLLFAHFLWLSRFCSHAIPFAVSQARSCCNSRPFLLRASSSTGTHSSPHD